MPNASLLEVTEEWKPITALTEVLTAPTVHRIHTDEPCHYFAELNLMPFDGTAPHRFQCFVVLRQNPRSNEYERVQFRRDLGLAVLYSKEEFQIPGGVQNDITGKFRVLVTVGKMIDAAEMLRGQPSWFANNVQPSDWQGIRMKAREDAKTGRLRRAVSGRYYSRGAKL